MKERSMVVLTSAFILLSAFSYGEGNKVIGANEQSEKVMTNVSQFDADGAYLYIRNQVDSDPRVSDTKEYVACGNYLAGKLEAFGAKVTDQYIDLIVYGGTLLKAQNIIDPYKPESKKRIALFTHWGTRLWTDNDADEKDHHTPTLGADDGASGVGALLEIAQLVNQQQPELGIDVIFLDAGDYGTPQFYEGKHEEEAWCLGSQYWSRNPHVQGHNAHFGILLDMVSGENSVFLKGGYSEEFAPDINEKVWKAAKKAGCGETFIDERGDTVTGDHLLINRLTRIKAIDIISNNPETGSPPAWHTIHDNIDHIGKNTLKAIGQTVLEVIYNERQIVNW